MKAYHWQKIIEERHAEEMARGLPLPAPRPAGTPPKINTRKGPPICVDCVHHSWRFEWMTGRVIHRCHDVMTRDPVTGAPTDPYANRKSAISCGPQGSYWRARPDAVARKPREIVIDDSEPMEYAPPVPVLRLEHKPDEVVAVLWQGGEGHSGSIT